MGSVYTTDQQNPDPAVVKAVVAAIKNGGCVVLPTDSVYGLVCGAYPKNPGHSRIFQIKQRALSQTLPLFVASEQDLMTFGKNIPDWMLQLTRAYWPGALTLVVEASDKVPADYLAQDGTVALRMPNSTLIREVCRQAGGLLANTSANTHGQPPATSGATVEARIIDACDLMVDAGPAPLAVPSTIVLAESGRPKVVREGAISAQDIYTVAG